MNNFDIFERRNTMNTEELTTIETTEETTNTNETAKEFTKAQSALIAVTLGVGAFTIGWYAGKVMGFVAEKAVHAIANGIRNHKTKKFMKEMTKLAEEEKEREASKEEPAEETEC